MKSIKTLLSGLLIIACVFTFTGCTKNVETEATEEKEVIGQEIANPWYEYSDLAEAQEAAGFTFAAPEEINGLKMSYIAVNQTSKMLEVRYGEDITIRKAMAEQEEDISGDYNDYEKETVSNGAIISYTVKGNDGTLWNNVTWNVNGYNYSITSNEGLELSLIDKLTENLSIEG